MKKRFLSTLMAVMMLLSLLPTAVFANAADEPTETWADAVKNLKAAPEGYSQEGTTIDISSALGLAWFAYQINSWESQAEGEKVDFKNYTINIKKDIDLSEKLWVPVDPMTVIANKEVTGYTSDRAGCYNNKLLDGATIDGQGNTISGMTIRTAIRGPMAGHEGEHGDGQSCYYYSAFIGRSNADLTIKNITFTGATVNAHNEPYVENQGSSTLAVVLGMNTGNLTCEDVHVTDSIVTGYTKLGGITGNDSGTLSLTDCSVTGCTFELESFFVNGDEAFGAMASAISGYKTGVLNEGNVELFGNSFLLPESYKKWSFTNEAGQTEYAYPVESGNYVLRYYTDSVYWAGNDSETTTYEGKTYAISGCDVGRVTVSSKPGTQYYDLAAAVAAAQNGDTVSLIGNVEFSDTISIDADKAITLNLNGHNAEYTGKGMYAVRLSGGIDLTITGEGTISSNNRVILVGDSAYNGSSTGTPASLTLEGGCTISTDYVQDDDDEWYQCAITVNANNTSGNDVIPCVVTINDATVTGAVYLFGRGAELNVNEGARLTSTSSYAIGGNGSGTHGGTEINIAGGTITQSTTETVKSGTAIYHPQDGTLNISGNPTITGYTGIQLSRAHAARRRRRSRSCRPPSQSLQDC